MKQDDFMVERGAFPDTFPPANRLYYKGICAIKIEELEMVGHTARHFLQIPGPSNVPDRVLRAMDMPTVDHRGPEFAEMALGIMESCKRILRTKNPVLIFPSSGTGA